MTKQPSQTAWGETTLDLHDRGLEALPDDVWQRTELEVLLVSDNRLTSDSGRHRESHEAAYD